MKKIISVVASLIFLVFIQQAVHAHCPLCTAAVGAGVVVTRFYGIDDSIVGLFIGGFTISTALWFNRVLKKQFIPFQEMVLSLLSVVLTVISFYFGGLFGNTYQTILGVDKLLFGTIIGSIVTYAGLYLSNLAKKLNSDKILFPFQSIVFILVLLSFTSFLFYLIIKP